MYMGETLVLLRKQILVTPGMEVYNAQYLATNSQGEGPTFDSMVRRLYTQNFVSGTYLLQGLTKFIITSHGYHPLQEGVWRIRLSHQLPR